MSDPDAVSLLRAVAAYRLAVEEVVALRSEEIALTKRVQAIPAELALAEQREKEARKQLLIAAGGERYGSDAVNQVESEISQGRTRIAQVGRGLDDGLFSPR